jgi:hypothetical protein
MPQKAWAVGEEVLAADFNTYLQNQVIPAFTTAAQRDSQWSAPPNGALCVTVDTYRLWQRVGGAWVAFGLAGMRIASIVTPTPQLVANSNAEFGTLADLNNVPIIAGRRTKIAFSCQGLTSNAAGDIFECRLKEDNVTVAQQTATIPATNGYVPCSFFIERTNLTAGNHHWQIILSRFAGSGLGGYQASGASPATLIVEDLGPS